MKNRGSQAELAAAHNECEVQFRAPLKTNKGRDSRRAPSWDLMLFFILYYHYTDQSQQL